MLKDAFDIIQAAVDRQVEMLRVVQAKQKACVDRGMWPAACREEWQTRGARTEAYLYLVFPLVRYGRYAGPDGRQKVYIGCKPSSVKRAQEKAVSRTEWEILERRRVVLAAVLNELECRVSSAGLFAESIRDDGTCATFKLF